jgi:hypothetical protein
MPGGTDEPMNPTHERWAARRVVDQHQNSGTCARCPDDSNVDCHMLTWAQTILAGAAPAPAVEG